MTFVMKEPKTEADFYRIAQIRSRDFGSEHVFIDLLFPRHNTHEGRLLIANRLPKISQEVPSSRFAMIRDSETGLITSQAECHFYRAESRGEVMDLGFVEGGEVEREYARHILGAFQEKRRNAIEKTEMPLLLLDSLTTDPEFHRRGAGSMLIKWGLEMADAISGEAYLEASEIGRPLYEKFGFKVQEFYIISVPGKWSDRMSIAYYLIRRPVRNPLIEI